MKIALLFAGSGPLVLATSHASLTDPGFLRKLKAKGVDKFIAYELPVEIVRRRYAGHYDVVMKGTCTKRTICASSISTANAPSACFIGTSWARRSCWRTAPQPVLLPADRGTHSERRGIATRRSRFASNGHAYRVRPGSSAAICGGPWSGAKPAPRANRPPTTVPAGAIASVSSIISRAAAAPPRRVSALL